jgi:hypothetical protein
MRKLRLRVFPVDHKCLDTEGEWDGTYDESFEYGIYDEEGFEVDGWDGFRSMEEARKEGEKKLKELEERK